ncbi:hypothetical protein SAMN03159489_02208 [Pseudomonas sp. NFPP07]|uniref:hypothetical protein n=1 Tax=Pseudomonas sp. NFPP07 TaxID=1566213 RepID=UPI0008F2BD88|nr:hypothetical protein [Pseudomonas sp. NFPP07]SFP92830.1 hypothetical protein SAMN03159489_02208 [Pseudomonas sp. NFPP07]
MSNNEMVSMPREVLVCMTNNQHKKVAAYMPDIADALRAVPAAGVEPEVLPQRKSWDSVFSQYALGETSGWNAACNAWEPHVTRLQAEVERLTQLAIDRKNGQTELCTEISRLTEELDALKAAQGEPVAYLDIGAGGYVDLGTDQPVEALENLPHGRHILGIIGTYGADGWQPSVKRPVSGVDPVAYAVFADNGDIRIWSRSTRVVEMISGMAGKPVPLYTEQPAPVAVVLPERVALRDIIAQAIGGDTYDCTRVWSAWGVGTMSEDDFVPLTYSEARLYEIADACLDEVARLNPSL